MIQGREWGSLYLHLATLAFSVFAETHSTELSSWRFTLPTLLLPQTTHTILPVSWKAVQSGEQQLKLLFLFSLALSKSEARQ